MKKLMFPLFAVLLFAACQNSTTTPVAPVTDTKPAPAELKIEPAQVKEASTKAKALMQNIDNLIKEVNATSATTKGPQKADLEAISGQLNDVMAKQGQMVKGLEAAENSGGADASSLNSASAPPPGVLQDYIESVDRYSKFYDDMNRQYEAIKSGAAKKN